MLCDKSFQLEKKQKFYLEYMYCTYSLFAIFFTSFGLVLIYLFQILSLKIYLL
jgi:hypothetical protein